MEGIELPNVENSERLEKKKLKILGNIGSELHQTSWDERKN